MCTIAYKICDDERFVTATVAVWLLHYVNFLADFDWSALLAKSPDS